jgi:glycosyltransferase involved in cell wall biosynthesis
MKVVTSRSVRVVIDYRPALKERSGVGEYTHQLVAALLAVPANGSGDSIDLTLFSSSWKDRLIRSAALEGATMVDKRIPVKLLNFSWHRLGWPPVEQLTRGTFDVTHSLHPLLLPSRAAAQVVTIHDLNFLTHPERLRAEIRRDYPALASKHAHRADWIVVPSEFTAGEVERRLGVPRAKIAVCPPGAPDWTPRAGPPKEGYVLFLGTLEPRKNVGALLDAYELLLSQQVSALPKLVLAGKATEQARPWLDRISKAPLKDFVNHIGYVEPAKRRSLFEDARLLVQPSYEEGFGIPVLEAMTVGVPVVASNRGALPEVLGDAGVLVDPDRPDQIADAIARLLSDESRAAECAARGLRRARGFRWEHTARETYRVYRQAIDHRRCASG